MRSVSVRDKIAVEARRALRLDDLFVIPAQRSLRTHIRSKKNSQTTCCAITRYREFTYPWPAFG
jgi:hypothetical protein